MKYELNGPVHSAERVRSLDVLRGVAVLGILYMNIQSFAMIEAAYSAPSSYGDLTGANLAVLLVGSIFFDSKFITIFTILFGAGIVLMAHRRAQVGLAGASLHFRRMAWLILLGLAHAYLLWFGDVLFMYAVLGMLLYPCRDLSAKALITAGLCLIVAALVTNVFGNVIAPYWSGGFRYAWRGAVQQELDAMRGSWLEQMPYRSFLAFRWQINVFPFFLLWSLGGNMLLGMALYKTGFLTALCKRETYVFVFFLGLAVAISLGAIDTYKVFATGRWPGNTFLHWLSNYFGSLIIALGWIGGVMWICKSFSGATWLNPLAATGRMALTNYLMQTIICTTLFYGHGLGWFGHVERTGQLAIVLVIWVVQLIASPLWLRHFHFGPFEWLWRSLTYWRMQPLRRRAATPLT
jgi:uncharacterized protein